MACERNFPGGDPKCEQDANVISTQPLMNIIEHQIMLDSTNAPSRFASIFPDGVLEPLLRAHHTWLCPCISEVLEATHEASQGSKTELWE